MWGLSAAGGQALRAAGYYFFDSLSALHLSQQALVVLIEGRKNVPHTLMDQGLFLPQKWRNTVWSITQSISFSPWLPSQ